MKGRQRLFLAFVSILLFVFGLQLLGESTQVLTDSLGGVVKMLVTGDLSSLGAGWFLAYMVLNGATSAAVGIAFLSSGLIDPLSTYMFISGSRLGATFIVVFIGVLEYLQGKNSDIRDSCSIGVLQFLATYMIYLPAIFLGYLALETWDLSFLALEMPASFNYGLDAVFGPGTQFLSSLLSPSLLFLTSIGLLLGSLRLFDRSFKGVSEEKFRSRYLRFRLSNKWISFLAGALVTLFSTSVALSVGIIVPLYNKGYFKRREIIPYLMGANLTTMISSVMAAAVIDSPVGMQMSLVLSSTVFLITLISLFFYDKVYYLLQRTFNAVMLEDRYLIGFTVVLFFTPLLLLIL